METLSRRYGPTHPPMWDGPLACVSDADHPACGCWPVMVCWLQYGPSIMSPLRAWSPGKDQLRVHSDVLPPISRSAWGPTGLPGSRRGGQGLCWPGQQCFQVQYREQGSVHWYSRPANGAVAYRSRPGRPQGCPHPHSPELIHSCPRATSLCLSLSRP